MVCLAGGVFGSGARREEGQVRWGVFGVVVCSTITGIHEKNKNALVFLAGNECRREEQGYVLIVLVYEREREEIPHRDQQQPHQPNWSNGDCKVEAFWDVSRPAFVEMEPITDADHLDLILDNTNQGIVKYDMIHKLQFVFPFNPHLWGFFFVVGFQSI
ncbi:unnamed protein product [Lactuca virosa]|uniref:Uncharacterized protein n=1 Tax=Lactuca virosa TaxID=75947 RepID=A0AAU9NNL2_9ASTR|nr:unnamed protein product [Lactuca virosa]